MRIPAIVSSALLLVAAAPPMPLPTAAPAVPPETRICIDLRQIRSTQMLPGTYDVRLGRDWWRNSARCPALGPNRAILTNTPTGRLCRGDIAEIVDPVSRFNFGGCGLGEWVKLARVAAEPAAAPPK